MVSLAGRKLCACRVTLTRDCSTSGLPPRRLGTRPDPGEDSGEVTVVKASLMTSCNAKGLLRPRCLVSNREGLGTSL